jgi:hydroxyacylglutathione hydrolase
MVEVYPSHFAGSICGRAMSGKPSSTIGFERRFNPALQLTDREAFITFVQKDQTPAPPEFATIRQANMIAQMSETA